MAVGSLLIYCSPLFRYTSSGACRQARFRRQGGIPPFCYPAAASPDGNDDIDGDDDDDGAITIRRVMMVRATAVRIATTMTARMIKTTRMMRTTAMMI